MTKIKKNIDINTINSFAKNEWIKFLKKTAYRGFQVQEAATHASKHSNVSYEKNQIKVMTQDKTVIVDMAELLDGRKNWSFSRLVHRIRMWFPESDYAKEFNDQIEKLAEAIIQSKKTQVNNSSALVVSTPMIDDINKEYSSLKDIGCKTAKEAIDCLINNPSITTANLIHFDDLTHNDLITLSNQCPHLKHLSFSLGIKATILTGVINKLPNLESLNIKPWSRSLKWDSGFDTFLTALSKLTNLKELLISGWEDPNQDKKFLKVAVGLPNLERLNLDYFSIEALNQLTDDINKFHKLQKLYYFRPSLSDDQVKALTLKRPNLDVTTNL